MGIIYTASTLGGTSLPEVNFPLPSGTLGLLLTNNSVWDLTVFSPLWNLTVPSYSVATMPASGNLQITVKGLSKDTTLIALSNASVSWGSSNVSVPLNISPIASKAVVPVQISGTVTAEIDTSGGPVEVAGSVTSTIDTAGGPVDISGDVAFSTPQGVNLEANNAGNLDININAAAISVDTNNSRAGGAINSIGLGSGITNYNNVVYTADALGLGAFTWCVQNSTPGTMNIYTVYAWSGASGGSSSVLIQPSTSLSAVTIGSDNSLCVSNLTIGTTKVGFAIDWSGTHPSSGTYNYEIFEYAS